MTLVNLFFFVHQPERLRPYNLRTTTARRPGTIHHHLFDEELNASIFRKVAQKSYYPATRLMLELIARYRDTAKPFKIAFGLSGTFLDQAERFEPELITLFQSLARTGAVEFTGETYYHSLAGLWDDRRVEFRRQVDRHRQRIADLFGQTPMIFRNTECLYNDGIAQTIQSMGFAGIITEGVDWVLEGWRSPDFLYRGPHGLPILLRNYRYSDDIAYRFPNTSWEHFPLTAEKFAGWLAHDTDEVVNIMMDYEALGEHIWADRGIFDFMRHLPEVMASYPQLAFTTPGEVVRTLQARGTISVGPFATISWADMERDTSAWLRNEMQRFCFEELRQLEDLIQKTNEPEFIRAWRLLQTSDHLYYLSDKALSDGDVHTYFSAYGNLFESFVRLQTAITDLKHAAMYYLDSRSRDSHSRDLRVPDASTAFQATVVTTPTGTEESVPKRVGKRAKRSAETTEEMPEAALREDVTTKPRMKKPKNPDGVEETNQ